MNDYLGIYHNSVCESNVLIVSYTWRKLGNLWKLAKVSPLLMRLIVCKIRYLSLPTGVLREYVREGDVGSAFAGEPAENVLVARCLLCITNLLTRSAGNRILFYKNQGNMVEWSQALVSHCFVSTLSSTECLCMNHLYWSLGLSS